MGMGTRTRHSNAVMWDSADDLLTAPLHPFYRTTELPVA
jgi:hypothetical protein